jgi:spermidine/putrescine-binding protein
MNNKGDLPVTILVIGVLAVCAFVGLELVEEANSQIETYSLQHYYDYENKTKFSPSFEGGFSLLKEVTIFSVEYNP